MAQEEGLKVLLQVYMDSAPRWVGVKYPDSLFVSSNGAVVIPESSPGYYRDHPGVRKADLAFYAALAETSTAIRLYRMGFMERAACHQLGDTHLHSESGILFL